MANYPDDPKDPKEFIKRREAGMVDASLRAQDPQNPIMTRDFAQHDLQEDAADAMASRRALKQPQIFPNQPVAPPKPITVIGKPGKFRYRAAGEK